MPRKQLRLPAQVEIAFWCDNHAICETSFKAGADAETRARIRGWGIWSGVTIGGKQTTLRLCPKCRDDKRRGTKADRLAPPEGSVPLF
jgi:hypothetical protein